MYNRRAFPDRRIWLLAVLIFARTAKAQVSSSAGAAEQLNCVSQYESRVATLLGCCGDLKKDYPGTNIQRATAALEEISVALRQKCIDRSSSEYLALLLDKAGAHLLRAKALVSSAAERTSPSSDATASAVDDTNKAVELLEMFTSQHPVEASQVWRWIATTLQGAGRPWLALSFLSRLDEKCCAPEQVAELRGDLLFELGVYDAAGKAYSDWLSASRHGSFCGHETSLANAAKLRSRGFSVPEGATGEDAVCTVISDWPPYVRFPKPINNEHAAGKSGAAHN